MKWTLRALIDDAGVAADITADANVTGMSYDAAHVRPGDLFCCIPGARADGHDFAPRAADAGAAALLVERELPLPLPQARVARVRKAMGPVASAFFGRPSSSLRVAGVTGTNGKTTTTHLVEAIAAAAGSVAGVIGTIDAHVGDTKVKLARTTPESVDLQRLLYQMLDEGADVVAMEVASDGLAQGRVEGTTFHVAAFTNLTQDHLVTHGTMADYFEAKALLFDRRFTSRAVINVDDPWGRRLLQRTGDLDVLTTSSHRPADVTGEIVSMDVTGIRARIRTPSGAVDVTSSLVGLDNLLTAAGISAHLGLGNDAVARGVAEVRVTGRLDPVDEGQDFLVLVDYAHTPDALRYALGAARELASGRVIVVFGCGGDRDRGKRPQMGEIATREADLTVVTSDNPRSEDPDAIIDEIAAGAVGALEREPDRRRAIERAIASASRGDVVLIAGKGHETGQTFATGEVPFDDREVARQALRQQMSNA
jgi:UDP-N-acetylmuramoyl-L-alanyl-D-glutamate--2,6-diaminopimelate ligase